MVQISQQAANEIAFLILARIQDRTAQGIDAEGKPFAAYSRRPFAAPAGALLKKAQRTLIRSKLASYFTTKTGALWIYVAGGYAAVRAASGRGAGVDMTFTGRMLSALDVVEASPSRITIGFNDPTAARVAFYHNVAGAGRGRTIRRFLGVSDQELETIAIRVLSKPGSVV